jgi:hypothetical protein
MGEYIYVVTNAHTGSFGYNRVAIEGGTDVCFFGRPLVENEHMFCVSRAALLPFALLCKLHWILKSSDATCE